MSKPNLFGRIVRALPRDKLDNWCREYGNEAPWRMDRRTAETFLISKDSSELRDEIVDYLTTALTRSIERRKP